MLPDATAANLSLQRLTRLYDGLEQLEDMWDDDLSDDGDSLASEGPHEQIWALNEQGEWEMDPEEDGDDWSTDEDDGMEVDGEGWSSSDPTALQSTADAPLADGKPAIEDAPLAEPPAAPSVPEAPDDVPKIGRAHV